jgi:hypothetical protein
MNPDGRVEAEPNWATMQEELERDSILIASRCVTRMFLTRRVVLPLAPVAAPFRFPWRRRKLRCRSASPAISCSSTCNKRMQVFANTASDSNLFPREMPRQCQDFFVQNLEKLVGDHIQRVESRSSI